MTVYSSLAFYNSLIKQDRSRTGAIVPIHCPNTQLPPFLISLGTDTVSTITSIKLVSCSGAETDITTYFSTLPDIGLSVATALGWYVQYNGDALTSLLPGGSYYVKITKSDVTYYSDWIRIMTMTNPLLKFVKIVFSNTDNVGDLRYEGSFAQSVWLEGILNTPTHEMVNTGEEKDGIFIAEKIVSKYVYSIISYVSRSLYNCLLRLPQHDTITITDEVGNTYTPEVGNVTVEPAEWVSFETCKVTIKFNDSSNSNFTWVK